MTSGRGKRVALASSVVGLAVIVVAAVASWSWIVETWWIYKLSAPEPEQQLEAAQKLGEMRSRRAIPDLVKLYQRNETVPEEHLLRVFIQLGPEAMAALLKSNPGPDLNIQSDREFLNVLAACLDQQDSIVRDRVFLRFRLSDNENLRPLIAKLKSSLEKETSPWARLHAAEILVQYRHSPRAVSSAIVDALNDGDHDLRGEAIRILLEMGPYVEYLFPQIEAAIPPILVAAQTEADEDQNVMDLAIFIDALPAYSDRDFPCPQIEAFIPELIRCLNSSNGGIREQAIMALAKIGPPARNAAPRLAKLMLEETANIIYRRAFLCLGAIGAPARVAIPGFIELVRREGPLSTDEMWHALEGVGEDPEMVPDLLKIVKDEEDWYYVRDLAAMALARVGAKDERAVRALFESLAGDSGPWLQESAAVALGTMGREEAVPALRKLLAGTDPISHAGAARALGMIGSRAADCVPDLIRHLPEEGTFRCACSRYYIAVALWKIAGDAKSALPRILDSISLWDDRSPADSREAIGVLGEMGPAAARAVTALIELLGKQSVSRAAAGALVKIGAASVLRLLLALQRDDWFLRTRAARVLGTIGPAAKEALPALQALVQDAESDEELSRAAAEAVEKIRGGSR